MQPFISKPAPIFCVYAMFCQEDGQQAYVKIGRSENVISRISTLRTNCPVPARFFAWVETETYGKSVTLEAKLHERFADRRSTGEWFKFNLLDPEERKYFNENCRWVFAKVFRTDTPPEWQSKDIDDLEKAEQDRRRRRFFTTKKGKRFAQRVMERQRNERELRDYRNG